MSLYIVFHKISSLLDGISYQAEFGEDAGVSINCSIDKLGPAATNVDQVTILNEIREKTSFKDGDSPDIADAAIDYSKDSITALLSQIPAASVPQSTQSTFPKIEIESSEKNVKVENSSPAFEKLDVSFRYRHDYTDILRNRLDAENSENIRKLTEKSQEKRCAAQDRQTELRFEEKQVRNFKECLKQKRFASHLQSRSE